MIEAKDIGEETYEAPDEGGQVRFFSCIKTIDLWLFGDNRRIFCV